MPTKKYTAPARKERARVQEHVKKLKDFYQLGCWIEEECVRQGSRKRKRTGHPKGTCAKIAKKAPSRTYVDVARMFATRYSRSEFNELCRLRMPPNRAPISITHVHLLVTVRDVDLRNELQDGLRTKGWSTRELARQIKALQKGVTRGGARRNADPRDLQDALVQVIEMCRRIKRWFQSREPREPEEGEGRQTVSTRDLKGLKRHMLAYRAAAFALEESAVKKLAAIVEDITSHAEGDTKNAGDRKAGKSSARRTAARGQKGRS